MVPYSISSAQKLTLVTADCDGVHAALDHLKLDLKGFLFGILAPGAWGTVSFLQHGLGHGENPTNFELGRLAENPLG